MMNFIEKKGKNAVVSSSSLFFFFFFLKTTGLEICPQMLNSAPCWYIIPGSSVHTVCFMLSSKDSTSL
jgi:hypothetical protein